MATIKILTSKSSIVSARLLKNELQNLVNHRVLLTQKAEKIFSSKFIRYGNSDPVNVVDTQYNSANFIRLSSNKAAFSIKMMENNIYSPIYNKANPTDNDFPLLIRKTLTSYGGRGIVVCRNREEFNNNWNNAYVWTKFIKTEFELRVHVIDGQVVRIFKKTPINEEQEYPIRNMDRGYHYSLRANEKYQKVIDLVNVLNPILNGKFFTLDIGWDSVKKKYLVFEINSGSGLNENTVKLYANFLAQKFN
jgi:glutathione synthase/RimK-type ligase-like ATP-grasp enzyme